MLANPGKPHSSSVNAGQPWSTLQDKLVKIGKKLKKNNVAVDIVSFGCEVGMQWGRPYLAFIGAVCGQ